MAPSGHRRNLLEIFIRASSVPSSVLHPCRGSSSTNKIGRTNTAVFGINLSVFIDSIKLTGKNSDNR